MCAAVLEERLLQLLKLTGYIKHIAQQGNGVGYTYGPAGALLRNNIKESWWRGMITKQERTFPVEGETLDPLSMYVDVAELLGKQLPFSIAVQGTCTNHSVQTAVERNRFLFDSLSSVKMKLLQFCLPANSTQAFDQLLNMRLQWWKLYAGNPSNFSLADAGVEDSIHSSHIQYQFPWGQETIETVINRGDNPLKVLEDQSGESCQVKHLRKMVHPHLLECGSTLEYAMATYLTDAFREKDGSKRKDGTNVQIMQMHPTLAPYKASIVTSGSMTRELREVAGYIGSEMRKAGISILDTNDSSSMEKQMIRNDQLGVPFSLIVSDKTLETGAVAIRSRDTTLKEQLAISKLVETIKRHLT